MCLRTPAWHNVICHLIHSVSPQGVLNYFKLLFCLLLVLVFGNVWEPPCNITPAIWNFLTLSLCFDLSDFLPYHSFFLFHFQQVINYDSSRGGVSVITEKGDTTTSFLLIQNADSADSGKYSCSPSNADSATVRVHVLNGMYRICKITFIRI